MAKKQDLTKKEISLAVGPPYVYVVYPAKGVSPVIVSNAGGAEIQEGSLVILDTTGVAVVIFGPGQWVTVNTAAN